MADYVVRVEAATSEAESKLRKVERQISNIDRDVKVNIQLPSLQQTTSALQTFGATAANVGKTALDLSRKLNVGPGAVLNDLEDLFGKVSKKGEQTVNVLQALSKATPTRILGTAFDSATGSVDRFSKQVANLGFVLFGVTQSVNVLKQAFGGFFDETIGREIRLQESLLRTKTTLISTADVVQNGRRITDPFQALTALDKPIEKTLENIRRRSLDIAGTTSDAIIQVFGVVASQVGAIGGSLKDAEDLAITFAGALGTIGMSDPMLANQEIRSILTGNIDQNSVLARSLGITNEEIQKAKRSSEGLVAYLIKRLEGFSAGQKLAAQGFAGIVSNIQEVREEAARSFGKPLLEPLLASLTTVYERLTLIFDQIKEISNNAGRAVSNLTSGLLYGASQAPVLQRFTPESQKGAADALATSTKNFAANVEREIDKVRPVISRITNEVIIAIARISQGLGALLQGFAYFKFEELKVMASTFANIAAVLNSTVVPALQAMLNLYGQFLQLPIVNYISQVTTVHTVLEKIGVNSILRLAGTWKFYQESINTAIGWVKTAASAISNAVKGTINFIANSISGFGRAAEAILTRIVNAATQGLILLIQAVSAAVQQLGVMLSRLGLQLQRQFRGEALGKVGVALRNLGRSFMNFDRQVAMSADQLRQFGQQATQSLEVVRTKADQTANSVRNLGQTIGTALTQGLQKAAKGLWGLAAGFIKFQLFLFAIQAATAAATEAFGRYQRATEQASNTRRTDEAINRLSTIYKDLGDNADEATKRAAAFDRQLLETRYTQNQQDIAALTEKITKLRKEMDTPGIQSWGELMRNVFVNPVTVIDVLLDKFTAVRTAFDNIGKFFQGIFDRMRDSVKSLTTNDDFKRWFVVSAPALTGLILLLKKLADGASFLIRKIDELAKRRLNRGLVDVLLDATPLGLPRRLLGARQEVVDEVNQRNRSEDESYLNDIWEEQQRIDALRDREAQEENTRLAAKARTDALKELKDYEGQLDKQLFDERQSLQRKEIEVAKAAELFKIEQIERANAKKLEGEEGASAAALTALNEYISTKLKSELEISTIQKELGIELATLDRKVSDYRVEMEKRIADIRMKAAQYDAQVTAAAAAGAGSGGQHGRAFTGNTGRSSGPHADIRGENRESVLNETVAAIRQWQAESVEYIQLSNARIDVKNMTDEAQLRAAVNREIDAHGSRVARGTYAADIAVPVGTRVPAALGGVQRDPGGGGYYGVNPSTGNRWLHLQEGSRGGSTAANGSSILLNENASRWAQAISRFEGADYNIKYGGGTFDNSKPHPMSGQLGNLTPHGRFQFQGPTWLDANGGRNLPMTKENQDRAFLWATRRRGVNVSTDAPTEANLRKLAPEFSSLPHGSESRGNMNKFLADFRAPLGSGSAGSTGSAPPPLPLPPPLPGEVTGKAAALGEDILAVQGQLKELLKREAEIKKQIAEANSKEKLEAIAKALFPTVPLEQFKNAQLELEKSSELTAKYAGLANDPERLAIAVDLTTRQAIAKRELAEFEKRQNELLKDNKLTEEEKKKIQDQIAERQKKFNADLAEEEKLRLTNLRLQRQSQLVLSFAKDKRAALYNTRSEIFEADAANQALALPEDDFLSRRMLGVQSTLFQKRIELEQANYAPQDIETYLNIFEQPLTESAKALAELDTTASELAERLALVKEATAALVDGYKGFLSSILSGSDIGEAAAQMNKAIAGRFVDMMLDFAFKPVEKQIEAMFKDFFKYDDAEQANTAAIKENSLKFEALTTKLNELIGALKTPTPEAPAASGTPTPAPTPESGLQTAFTGEAANNIVPLDFNPAVPFTGVKFDPSSVMSPDWDGTLPPLDFSATEASFQNFQASTATLAAGVQESAKKTDEGTDTTLTGMQKYATGLASVATAALGIVGGIEQIKEGGASNVLAGIGSIFLGVGGAIGGFSSMFKPKAAGGGISANTPYLVGERGPELFMPNNFGSIKPNNQLREAMTTAANRQAGPSVMEFRFKSEVINRREYISADQLEEAMANTRRRAAADGARRGMAMTIDRFEQSPRTRARAGFR